MPYKRWNDCYYDEKLDVYVVQNQKVISNYAHKFQNSQNIDLRQENMHSNKSQTIAKNQVEFVQEYSALLISDEHSEYSLILPTITDEMLTKKLVLEKWYPKQKRIIYYTESECWIDHLGDKLCTKEYEILQDAKKISQNISIEMMQQIQKVAND